MIPLRLTFMECCFFSGSAWRGKNIGKNFLQSSAGTRDFLTSLLAFPNFSRQITETNDLFMECGINQLNQSLEPIVSWFVVDPLLASFCIREENSPAWWFLSRLVVLSRNKYVISKARGSSVVQGCFHHKSINRNW